MRTVKSAPIVVTPPKEEYLYTIRMDFENWIKETNTIESQVTEAIHKARVKKDRGHMMLLKEKLKNLQRYIETKNLEISSAIQRAEVELAQQLIFDAFEILYTDAYNPSTRDVSRVPVYRTPSGGAMALPTKPDMRGSRLPVFRPAKPTRSISEVTVAEKQRQEKQAIGNRRQFVNRQEQIRQMDSKSKLIPTDSRKGISLWVIEICLNFYLRKYRGSKKDTSSDGTNFSPRSS